MYCEFFGLRCPPFNNTPDTAFFFRTPEHEEAVASLLYAVQERKGFMLLTGEVGAGKTLISRVLLQQLDSRYRTAVITNSAVTAPELLTQICRELELPVDPEADKRTLLERLEQFLLDCYGSDRVVVIILDEGQNLPDEVFEELRMLGNLESEEAKLLQVLILGQPELKERFTHPAMLQMRQRLFRSFHLHELDGEQTVKYIQHRMDVAGGADRRVFTPEAVELIYQYSGGVPRMINQICDNALLTAYGRSSQCVDVAIIQAVVEDGAAPAQPLEPQPNQEVDHRFKRLERVMQQVLTIRDQTGNTGEQLADLQRANQELSQQVRGLSERADRTAPPEDQASQDEGVEELARRLDRLEQGVQDSTADGDQAAALAHSEEMEQLARTVAELSQRVGQLSEPARNFDQPVAEAGQAEAVEQLAQRLVDLEQHVQQAAQDSERVGELSTQLARLERGDSEVSRQIEELSGAADRWKELDSTAARAEALDDLAGRLGQVEQQLQETLADKNQSAAIRRQLEALERADSKVSRQIEELSEAADRWKELDSTTARAEALDNLAGRLGQAEQRLAEMLAADDQTATMRRQLEALEQTSGKLFQDVQQLQEQAAAREHAMAEQTGQALEEADRAGAEATRLEQLLQDHVAEADEERPGLRKLRLSAERIAAQLSRSERRTTELIVQLGQTADRASLQTSRLAEQAQQAEKMAGGMARMTQAVGGRMDRLQEQLDRADDFQRRLPAMSEESGQLRS